MTRPLRNPPAPVTSQCAISRARWEAGARLEPLDDPAVADRALNVARGERSGAAAVRSGANHNHITKPAHASHVMVVSQRPMVRTTAETSLDTVRVPRTAAPRTFPRAV